MRNSWTARVLVVLSFLLISGLLIYHIFLSVLIRNVAPEIQLATRAVLNSYYLSMVTGAYWEDDFATQAIKIKKYSQQERLGFYRTILVNCDMETTKVMVFAQYAKPDANALRQDLIDKLRAGEFSDPVRQKRVKNWINELQIVALVG